MEPAIRTEGLTKFYGATRGVEGLDLEVRRGEVFGFLGPNGAGKTTTIRLLLDLIRPTAGRATVLGLDAHRQGEAVRRRVGYLPGELALYDALTPRELFTYLGNLRGGVPPRRVEGLAERLKLALDRPIRHLSRGNKQKVGLVQAFMHAPELLILDEPTGGLDPLMQQEFNTLVREARDDGATVFLSSHVLSEVERIADRVAIIRDGRLVVVEGVAALKGKAVRLLEVHFASVPDAAAFEAVPGVREVAVEASVLRCFVEGSVDPLVKALARHEVLNIVSHEPDLEEIFLTYYREPGGSAADAADAAGAANAASATGASDTPGPEPGASSEGAGGGDAP